MSAERQMCKRYASAPGYGLYNPNEALKYIDQHFCSSLNFIWNWLWVKLALLYNYAF